MLFSKAICKWCRIRLANKGADIDANSASFHHLSKNKWGKNSKRATDENEGWTEVVLTLYLQMQQDSLLTKNDTVSQCKADLQYIIVLFNA